MLLLAHVLFGAILLLLSVIARATGVYFLQAVAGYALFGIGLSQLLYAIPLVMHFRRRRRFNTVKGVVIGAVITVLLNGGCFLFVLWELSRVY